MKYNKNSINLQNILETHNIVKAQRLAKKLEIEGQHSQAVEIHRAIITKYPKNRISLKALSAKLVSQQTTHPEMTAPADLKILIHLYHNKDYDALIDNISQKQDLSSTHLNLLGAAFYATKQTKLAKNAFKRAIKASPRDHEAHNNLGKWYLDADQIEKAIPCFQTAMEIKPDFAIAHCNQGIALRKAGNIRAALDSLIASIRINDSDPLAHLNIAKIYAQLDQLSEAMKHANKTLKINSNSAEAYLLKGKIQLVNGDTYEALQSLEAGLTKDPSNSDIFNSLGVCNKIMGNIKAAYDYYCEAYRLNPSSDILLTNMNELHCQLPSHPTFKNWAYLDEVPLNELAQPKHIMFKMFSAIKMFTLGKYPFASDYLNSIELQDIEKQAKEKNSKFCRVFHNYLNRLMNFEIADTLCDKCVYHIGESHSLSFAHHCVEINGQSHKIVPLIILGAKAYHFSNDNSNQYKAIASEHLMSAPKGSKIFITFGEIDCRPNEGLITAAKKKGARLEELIITTVDNYVNWFETTNKKYGHRLIFFKVPCPVYNQRYSPEENKQVLNVIESFNSQLEIICNSLELSTIDTFSISRGASGFSTGNLNVDLRHLGPHALAKIQNQITVL